MPVDSTGDEGRPTGDGEVASDVLGMVLPVDPYSPSIARDRIRRWLAELGWPDESAEDVVYAVSEMVSNAVEHAYPANSSAAEVRIAARTLTDTDGHRRAEVVVEDDGNWRPPPNRPGYRGHGIPATRARMADVVISHEHGGTSVLMISTSVPPATSRD